MGITKVASSPHEIEYGYGDDFQTSLTITSEGRVPVDITGYSFVLTVDSNEDPDDSSTNIFSVTGSILDAANGVVGFSPTSTNTSISPKSYFYDVKMTDDSGRKRTLIKGKFVITQGITKND